MVPSDPLDTALDDFRRRVLDDGLPTPIKQLQLVRGTQHEHHASGRELVRSHLGLIAAVAYPFKYRGVGSKDLLILGLGFLIQAALTYDLEDSYSYSFNDHAVESLEGAFRQKFGEDSPDIRQSSSELSPTDRIVDFARRLEVIDGSKPVFPPDPYTTQLVNGLASYLRLGSIHQKKEAVRTLDLQLRILSQRKAAQQIADLPPEAQEMLPLMHLSTSEILARKAPMTKHHLQYLVGIMMQGLGASNRRQVMLVAFEAGKVQLDQGDLPPLEQLTIRERQVGSRLHNEDTAIAEELGLTLPTVLTTERALRRKMQMTSRIQLMLAGRRPGFEPTKEEIEEAAANSLERLSPLQQKVIPLLHYTMQEIATKLGPPHTYDSVKQAILAVQRKEGVDNVVALALALHEKGVKYDIEPPPRPLIELLDNEHFKVVENDSLAHSNSEIAEATQTSVSHVENFISDSKSILGARSRVELALKIKIFDTGERISAAQWRKQELAVKLGLGPSEDWDFKSLLSMLTRRRRKAIAAYHLIGDSEEPKKWTEIDKRLGSGSKAAATEGIKQLRQLLKSRVSNNERG